MKVRFVGDALVLLVLVACGEDGSGGAERQRFLVDGGRETGGAGPSGFPTGGTPAFSSGGGTSANGSGGSAMAGAGGEGGAASAAGAPGSSGAGGALASGGTSTGGSGPATGGSSTGGVAPATGGSSTGGSPFVSDPECTSIVSGTPCSSEPSCEWTEGCTREQCECMNGFWVCYQQTACSCPSPLVATCGAACELDGVNCLCNNGHGPDYQSCTCTGGMWDCG